MKLMLLPENSNEFCFFSLALCKKKKIKIISVYGVHKVVEMIVILSKTDKITN